MTDNRKMWEQTGLSVSFDTTYGLATGDRPAQTLIYRLSEPSAVILSDHQPQKVTMRRYVKSEFDQAQALSGKWTPHPNPIYRQHRLEVRVERGNWQARLINPIEADRRRRPYIDRSLKCKPAELETALERAVAFYNEKINPFVAVPDLRRYPARLHRGRLPVQAARRRARFA